MIGAVLRGEEEAKKWFNGVMKQKEAASYLGISVYKIRKLREENKIPYSQIFKNIYFHKTILDAWKMNKFPNGRVELVLDDESINFAHEEALKEHYKRYPELAKEKEALNKKNKPLLNNDSEIDYQVKNNGVELVIGSNHAIKTSIFLSNKAIIEMYNDINKN
ncbi:hypothetical protein CHH77_02115 [Shouchella clausii]|uniref:helix-turn-helix domain-containing protein n=1 Tax=Shouchella clausii TaxID=79880 RepID=UPI000BA5473C|nr:helix-turn-helix domain-containing protein [Shouchella clausii]MCZ1180159.1 DNA-binding protein [Shouchella clausii]PAE84934.1 hypothetical protein CHH77_02115 [Shouchella clausii]